MGRTHQKWLVAAEKCVISHSRRGTLSQLPPKRAQHWRFHSEGEEGIGGQSLAPGSPTWPCPLPSRGSRGLGGCFKVSHDCCSWPSCHGDKCPRHCWDGWEGGPCSHLVPHETLRGGVKWCSKRKSQWPLAVPGVGEQRVHGGDGRWWGEALPRPLSSKSLPTPIPLQAPRPLGFTFHFCSSSMVVSGHCSVEKDKNVFSLEALFQTFSPRAKGLGWEASPWQSGPRQGAVALDGGGAAWVDSSVRLSICGGACTGKALRGARGLHP